MSRRAQRALPLMAGALAAIVVVGLVYLHPAFLKPRSLPSAAPAPGPPLLPNQYLAAYDFLTPATGWALVEEVTTAAPRFWVFRTSDAAKHWQRQLSGSAGSTNAGPLKIQFFDRSNGLIALGALGAVYRTRDGGFHWTALTLPAFSYSVLFFSDRLHGWVLGTVPSPDPREFDSKLFSTSDGGDHWDPLPQPPAWQFAGKGSFGTFTFRSPNEGWIGGATPDRATVYSTIDGGMTWQSHALPVTSTGQGGMPEGAGLPLLESDVYMLPGSGVLAVAVDPNAGPIGLTSFDNGASWRHISPPPGETAYGDFIFVDAFHWWAMRYGTLFKSSDAGQTWKEVAQQLDEWDYIPQVIDAKHAWAQMAVIFPGANPSQGTGLAVTSDGGLHWSPVNVPKPS